MCLLILWCCNRLKSILQNNRYIEAGTLTYLSEQVILLCTWHFSDTNVAYQTVSWTRGRGSLIGTNQAMASYNYEYFLALTDSWVNVYHLCKYMLKPTNTEYVAHDLGSGYLIQPALVLRAALQATSHFPFHPAPHLHMTIILSNVSGPIRSKKLTLSFWF